MPSLRELRHRDALSQRCDGRLGTSLTSRRRRRRPVLLGGGSVEALSYAVYASPPDRCADRSKPPLRGLSGGRVSLARGRGLPCQAAPRHMVSTAERTSLVVPGPRRDRGASYPARDRARRPRLLADGASATLGHRPVAAEAARWLSEVTCAVRCPAPSTRRRGGPWRRCRAQRLAFRGQAEHDEVGEPPREATASVAACRGEPMQTGALGRFAGGGQGRPRSAAAASATSSSRTDPDAQAARQPGPRPHLVHRAQIAVDPRRAASWRAWVRPPTA